jgi:hypothetical protein
MSRIKHKNIYIRHGPDGHVSRSGPVKPDYLQTCCQEFQSEVVCEASPGNTVLTVTGVPDLATCQKLCQVKIMHDTFIGVVNLENDSVIRRYVILIWSLAWRQRQRRHHSDHVYFLGK